MCISILHPPGDDPISGELPSERWNPSQSVRTILLSVISLLSEPNCASPANIEASVLYRKYKDASQKKKLFTEYAKIVSSQVKSSNKSEIHVNWLEKPIRFDFPSRLWIQFF